MDALFAQASEHGLIGLEQAQRLFGHAGHQVGDILLQRLHGAREDVQGLRIGDQRTRIDGFQQALGGLAVHIDAAQADDQQRAGGLVQILAGQAQRGGVACPEHLGVGHHIGNVFTEFADRVVQRGAHVGRNPGQRGQIARRRGRNRTRRSDGPGRLEGGGFGLGGRWMMHEGFQKACGGCVRRLRAAPARNPGATPVRRCGNGPPNRAALLQAA